MTGIGGLGLLMKAFTWFSVQVNTASLNKLA